MKTLIIHDNLTDGQSRSIESYKNETTDEEEIFTMSIEDIQSAGGPDHVTMDHDLIIFCPDGSGDVDFFNTLMSVCIAFNVRLARIKLDGTFRNFFVPPQPA